jgi:Flp pilus assembly protein CpaB
MSSITATNPERTNRWLLIGGVALAVITGILVFAAVANFGEDDGESAVVTEGDNSVLVATEDIAAGTKLEEDMFRTATFATDDLIVNPLSDAEAIVGQTVARDLLRGQQLSRNYLVTGTDDTEQVLSVKLPDGHRAIGLPADEVKTYGGLLLPGDRVDVILTFTEKESAADNARTFLVVRTVLQNVLVMAREQTQVAIVGGVPTEGEEEDQGSNAPPSGLDAIPDDVDTGEGIGVVTLALTPEDSQRIVQALEMGEITLALRKLGDEGVAPVEDLRIEQFD